MFLVDCVRLVVGVSTAAVLLRAVSVTVGVRVIRVSVSVQLRLLVVCFRRLGGGRKQGFFADGFLEEFSNVTS